MKLYDLLTLAADTLTGEREIAMTRGLDAPLDIPQARHLRTIGALHLYSCTVPPDFKFVPDVPVTILPGHEMEPTEVPGLEAPFSFKFLIMWDQPSIIARLFLIHRDFWKPEQHGCPIWPISPKPILWVRPNDWFPG